MTPMAEASPIEVLASAWQTMKKFPSIHSHFSFSVILPPAPIELCLKSPSSVHEPAKTSSFLCSGPGLGASICATAAATSTDHIRKIIPDCFISTSQLSVSAHVADRIVPEVRFGLRDVSDLVY